MVDSETLGRLSEIERILERSREEIRAGFGVLHQRLDVMQGESGEVMTRLGSVEGRLGGYSQDLGSFESVLRKVENEQSVQGRQLDTIATLLGDTHLSVSSLGEQVSGLGSTLGEQVRGLGRRFDFLSERMIGARTKEQEQRREMFAELELLRRQQGELAERLSKLEANDTGKDAGGQTR